MRVVFMGTPQFGVPSLRALHENGYEVAGVFCQPDRPKGRGNKLMPCPVKELALSLGLPVFQPNRMRMDGAEMLKSLSPDLCVTVAFGQILSEENLAVPAIGTVNVHSSLLPKYRGSAPINWALICGETVTGVTTMMTDKGMDTGDILLQREYHIPDGMAAGELTEKLSELGAELLIETIRKIEAGNCPRVPQESEKATYYSMLKKEMGQLDFTKPAQEIVHLVRGVDPWPGAYTFAGKDMVKVLRAHALQGGEGHQPYEILTADAKNGLTVKAGDGIVEIDMLQMPGGKKMSARDYLRGHTIDQTCFERREVLK